METLSLIELSTRWRIQPNRLYQWLKRGQCVPRYKQGGAIIFRLDHVKLYESLYWTIKPVDTSEFEKELLKTKQN